MKIFIIIMIVVIILLLVAYFMIGNYFYNIALNPNTSKEFVLGPQLEETQEQKEKRLEIEEWLNEKSQEIYITTSNNKLNVHGYEILNLENTNMWTILVHGYCGEGKDMVNLAQEYYNRGYNVLIIDLRGHGKSEGNYIGMGWHDRLDLIDWCNYLINKNDNCKIILHGVSMGAATVMMATGEKLPKNVKIAIEDCGYTSMWDEFKIQLEELFNLPAFPVLNAASTVCKIKAGYKLKEGSCIEQVRKSKTPTLFIHGNQDKFVPFEMLDSIYESASCKKQKLVIEGAAHAQASTANPKLYWKTIDEFIVNYME